MPPHPCGVLRQLVQATESDCVAIGVVPVNVCKGGLVGIRGKRPPRGWDTGMGKRLNMATYFGLSVSRINAARSSLPDKKWDGHIRSPCCHVTRGLRTGFRKAKRNRAPSLRMYCTNHRACPPRLSLGKSVVFGTNFGGRGGDGGANPINMIASCKASVIAARAAVSLVNVTGKGTGPTTSSPSVS